MTATQLANIALGHLGESRIANIDELSPQAEHCRRMWELARDALLRARHWNFALAQAILAPLATPPLLGRSYAYKLPTDYLLAVEFNGLSAGTGEANFDLIGDTMQTDDATAALLYVRRETNVGKWDPSFCEAFGYKLAAYIAPSISSAQGVAERLTAAAEQIMLRAFGPDNLETRPRAVLAMTGSGYLRARLGLGSERVFAPVINIIGTVAVTPPTPAPGMYLVDPAGNTFVDMDGNPLGVPGGGGGSGLTSGSALVDFDANPLVDPDTNPLVSP
jgi:hypothetical protein